MEDDVKRVPIRLERDLFRRIAQYALDNGMSRTDVIRECIAAKFPEEAKPTQQVEVTDDGKSKGKGSKGKRTAGRV
jgi:hypothetical protein